jgi:transcriptional regulator with XRE-family HTH domain
VADVSLVPHRAMKMAARETINFLTERFPRLSRQEAYMIASIAVDYHVTQVVDGTKGIHGSHRQMTLGLTFQQVQKYEKGTNRFGASRLQHLPQILQVPVPFFFEGAPAADGIAAAAQGKADAPPPDYVRDFLATSAGLELVQAFMCIEDRKLRRAIVQLVEEIAGTG